MTSISGKVAMSKKTLVERLANGKYTAKDIADMAGVAESTVREYVRRACKQGRQLKYKKVYLPPWSDEDIQELKNLREQGLSYRTIAKQYGRTAPVIYRLLNKRTKDVD